MRPRERRGGQNSQHWSYRKSEETDVLRLKRRAQKWSFFVHKPTTDRVENAVLLAYQLCMKNTELTVGCREGTIAAGVGKQETKNGVNGVGKG